MERAQNWLSYNSFPSLLGEEGALLPGAVSFLSGSVSDPNSLWLSLTPTLSFSVSLFVSLSLPPAHLCLSSLSLSISLSLSVPLFLSLLATRTLVPAAQGTPQVCPCKTLPFPPPQNGGRKEVRLNEPSTPEQQEGEQGWPGRKHQQADL